MKMAYTVVAVQISESRSGADLRLRLRSGGTLNLHVSRRMAQRIADNLVAIFNDPAKEHVQRAEKYAAAHHPASLSPDGLAAAAGCSNRTLREAFRIVRGQSIIHTIIALRLDAARARLMEHRLEDTITSVMTECGFTNHHRFGKSYRNRFGEWPSETYGTSAPCAR